MKNKPLQTPVSNIRSSLDFQHQISWQLLDYHLTGLVDEEYRWRPAARGLHVANESGVWRADWPESETYDIGPASIAWLTWHITFWWSMVLDNSFGNGTLTREEVRCPGNIEETIKRINQLRMEWQTALAIMPDDELLAVERTKWPFTGKPFHELAAWLNLELMKNASEIGYCRFLYASRNNNGCHG
ncbi:DinB family protein [Paenibacillus arenilitoris]|uniref:DinB family protein n=1 Tax=Paenibacillus arenilitoris TaxID=2772299 RepID=A0A927CKZ9_9BACL|nr:DinB family protein [Paenibacillus arenilitoris]MBD2870013.1 DinB family protein [Paenibacillus arenilitoris]